MMTEFPELDGTGSGDGTDSAMFNIAEQDVFSHNTIRHHDRGDHFIGYLTATNQKIR
jgi:hypothetical protein